MKKHLFYAGLFILFGYIILPSCSKDSNSSGSGSIVGKWNISSFSVRGGEFPVDCDGTPSDYIDFKSNGTYEISLMQEFETGEYSVSGNKLTIGDNFDSETYDINKLTRTECILYMKEYDDVEQANIETTINLKK